jgi:hypothetical protein
MSIAQLWCFDSSRLRAQARYELSQTFVSKRVDASWQNPPGARFVPESVALEIARVP